MSTYLLYPFRLLAKIWRGSAWPLKTLYVLLIMFFLLSLVLPRVLKIGIEKALLQQGIQQVELAGVEVDLLEGRVSISQLDLTTPEGQPLTLGKFVVDFSWLGLLDNQLKLELIELNKTHINVVLQPDEWIDIAGIRIPLDVKQPAPTDLDEEMPSLALSWGLGLDAFVLKDSQITFKTPDFERTITFKKVRLTQFYNWQTADAARLQFEIGLLQKMTDSIALLKGDLKVQVFNPIQTASGIVYLEQLALPNIQVFLPKDLGDLSGNLISSIAFELSNDQGKIFFKNTAGITLKNFKFSQPEQSLGMHRLQWVGNSIVEYQEGKLKLESDAQLSLDGLEVGKKIETEGNLDLKVAQVNMRLKQDLSRQSVTEIVNLLVNFDNDLNLKNLELSTPKQLVRLTELKFNSKGQGTLKNELFKPDPKNSGNVDSLSSASPAAKAFNQNLKFKSDSKLSLNEFRLRQELDDEQTLQANFSQLNWHLNQAVIASHLQNSPSFHVNFDDDLVVQNIKVTLPDQTVGAQAFTLNSKGDATYQEGAFVLEMKNQQSVQNVTALIQGLSSHLGAQTWLGDVSVKHQNIQADDAESVMQIATQGNLALEDLVVNDETQDLNVLAVKHFATDVDLAEDQTLLLKKMTATDVLFAKSAAFSDPLLQLKELLVSDLSLSEKQDVHVRSVLLTGLNIDALLTPQKKIAQLEPVLAMGVLNPSKAPETDAADVPISEKEAQVMPPVEVNEMVNNDTSVDAQAVKSVFAIDQFSISPDSQVKLVTQTTQPQLQTLVKVKRFEVGALSTKEPDATTPLDIDLAINQYTQATIKGGLAPLAEKVNARLDVKISDLDLYTFSPLIQQDLGLKIQSGGLNMDNTIKITDSILDSQNKLKLIGFKLVKDDKKPEPTSAKPSKPKGIKGLDDDSDEEAGNGGGALSNATYGLALDLLRDGDNNIKLDVPIKGDLSDPKFNASQVIQVALQNTLMSGSKAMLMMTLQPYGAIFLASKYAFDKATAVYLENVKTEAGSSNLLPDMDNYLIKVTALLTKQKQVTLKVCGYYTSQDRAALLAKKIPEADIKGQLYQLAKDRQDLVKERLVNKGVTSNRLTLCQPEAREDETPGVSLSI